MEKNQSTQQTPPYDNGGARQYLCEEQASDSDSCKTQRNVPKKDIDVGAPAISDRQTHIRKARKMTAKALAYTAVMTALVYVGSLIGYSGAQFYFNLGDSVILICAALLDPVSAMIAGGLGSFFCDLTVYPATMIFTLVIKASEGLFAGIMFKLINSRYDKTLSRINSTDNPLSQKQLKTAYVLKIFFSYLASLASVTVMMSGYFLCQSLFYGTMTGALVALPFDAAQGAISSTVAMLALYLLKLDRFRHKIQFK